MYKVSAVWIVSEFKELLLARRSVQKSRDPAMWGPSVTGTVNDGETYEQSAVREVGEELGLEITLEQLEYLFDKDFMHPDGDLRKFKIFLVRLPKNVINQVKLQLEEVDKVQWAKREEIENYLKNPANPTFKLVSSATELWPEVLKLTFDK